MQDIEIRLCTEWEDCLQCEELQKQVWEMPDYRDAVPANLLITALKNGGLLVGAFRGKEMVGFAFGFLGSEKTPAANAPPQHENSPYGSPTPRLKHTSHMLAVIPDVRVKGLGAQLKWAQRTAALKQGLDLMTWTYDPLQAVNGHLNLNRLGAIARRYYRNAYGEMTDGLNAGMASDRFEVEWYLNSPLVRGKSRDNLPVVAPDDAQVIYTVRWNTPEQPVILSEAEPSAKAILIQVPADIAALKAQSLELGIQWRERTRGTFERAFALGYVATDVVRETNSVGIPQVYYLLNKDFDTEG